MSSERDAQNVDEKTPEEPQYPSDSRTIRGWKDIAAFLGVEKTTAQRYEREQGLPIIRPIGSKSAVYAEARELRAWLKRTETESAIASEPTASAHAEAPPNPPRLRRSHGARIGIAIGCASLLILALYVFLIGAIHRVPTACRVEGQTIVAVDSQNRAVWRFDATQYIHEPFTTPLSLQRSLLADVGNGGPDLFVPINPKGNVSAKQLLYCISSQGSLRWTFEPGRIVKVKSGGELRPPYGITSLQAFGRVGSVPARVVVTSLHHYTYPTQVALLDASGKLLGEYWHHGHLNVSAVMDAGGDGVPELLLAGVNDNPSYNRATLVAFDSRDIHGSSSGPDGTLDFPGQSESSQKVTVFFPRSTLSTFDEFNQVRAINVQSYGIEVIVSENANPEDGPYVVYELDRQLNLRSVVLSDPYKVKLRQLEANGKLPSITVDSEVDRLRAGYLVIRSKRIH